ncbi:hypothetical protein FACS189413_05550 [Bacteroidia bacterium]|nr:hypothetical protein FACS189413_05550 [Bacteroidia bacterium]
MTKKYIFPVLTLIILFSSCDSDPQMDRTIFIPDETEPELPAYTEWGYNSFGAIYDNRSYFVVSSVIAPCKILYKEGHLHFSLNGIMKGSYLVESEKITLDFIFPSEKIEQYNDLLMLNDKQINLTSTDCVVKIIRNENERTLNVIDGILHFKRAQHLYIDDRSNRVILSGIFALRFLEYEFPTIISGGRFDVGINNNVFYAY